MREPYIFQLIKDAPRDKSSIKMVLGELRYWYIHRQTRKLIPWVARQLPNSLKYWVVIHGMVTVEPRKNPDSVTGLQLLRLWEKEAYRV